MADAPVPFDVLAIDDAPEVLALFEDLLGRFGHRVRAFASAPPAIQSALAEPPEVVLLDLAMPGMDGIAACVALKSHAVLEDVPVIVVTAADQPSQEIHAFAAGAVDFVSKPIQPAVVLARIATQVRLRRLQLAERELLHRTLTGTVNALVELVGVAAPSIDARGRSVRAILRHVAQQLGLRSSWRLELAGRLFMVGCIALPQELVERASADAPLTDDERTAFARHPAAGGRLLTGIPRLEAVARMIAGQSDPPGPAAHADETAQGTRLLQLAIGFDRRLQRGVAIPDAVASLRAEALPADAPALEALLHYPGEQAATRIRVVRTSELRAGMVLDEDIRDDAGTLIAGREMQLTPPLIERLTALASRRGIQGPFRIRLPAPEHAAS